MNNKTNEEKNKAGKTLKHSWSHETITVNIKNIDCFKVINPRRVRAAQVKSIYEALENGEHFQAPLAVNRIEGNKYEIRDIDGNHRLLGTRKYLEKHPEDSIAIPLCVFHNLTTEEERQIYSKINRQVTQKPDDFINAYKDTIPTLPYMLEQMPITINPSKGAITVRLVTEAYFISQQEKCKGTIEKIELVEKMQKLKKFEVDDITETFNIIQKAFNPNNITDFRRLSAFKTTPFIVIFFLVQKAKRTKGKEYIIDKLSKKLTPDFLQKNAFPGFKGRIFAYDQFVKKIKTQT